MRSIDELAPQEIGDDSEVIQESGNALLEGLQTTVKQLSDGCNQIVETVGKVLEHGNVEHEEKESEKETKDNKEVKNEDNINVVTNKVSNVKKLKEDSKEIKNNTKKFNIEDESFPIVLLSFIFSVLCFLATWNARTLANVVALQKSPEGLDCFLSAIINFFKICVDFVANIGFKIDAISFTSPSKFYFSFCGINPNIRASKSNPYFTA